MAKRCLHVDHIGLSTGTDEHIVYCYSCKKSVLASQILKNIVSSCFLFKNKTELKNYVKSQTK